MLKLPILEGMCEAEQFGVDLETFGASFGPISCWTMWRHVMKYARCAQIAIFSKLGKNDLSVRKKFFF